MTRKIQPYESDMLNNMDIGASTATMFTVLFGMFFLDKDEKSPGSLLYAIVILLVFINVSFIVYWVLHICPIIG